MSMQHCKREQIRLSSSHLYATEYVTQFPKADTCGRVLDSSSTLPQTYVCRSCVCCFAGKNRFWEETKRFVEFWQRRNWATVWGNVTNGCFFNIWCICYECIVVWRQNFSGCPGGNVRVVDWTVLVVGMLAVCSSSSSDALIVAHIPNLMRKTHKAKRCFGLKWVVNTEARSLSDSLLVTLTI